MHLNFGHLILGVWSTPRGVGKLRVIIMGRMRSMSVGLRLQTLVVNKKLLKLVGGGVQALVYLLFIFFGEGV